MDDYAGRVLADRYRLPPPPTDEYELAETRAFDLYSGQEVLLRQVPLPEVVEAEVLDADGLPEGFVARDSGLTRGAAARTAATGRPADPAVRRAIEAAQAAAQVPDHPRLDQVFDVFAEGGSLWIVSEAVSARPLAALLAERPLTPYRAAEVASDVLMALRVLHEHGWVHRNITAGTVLVCDDGRVVLAGLAAGAAEDALCGYDPMPVRESDGDAGDTGSPERCRGAAESGAGGSGGAGVPGGPEGSGGSGGFGGVGDAGGPGGAGEPGGAGGSGPLGSGGAGGAGEPAGSAGSGGASGFGGYGGAAGRAVDGFSGAMGGAARGTDPEAARRAAIEARANGPASAGGMPGDGVAAVGPRAPESAEDVRAARAGAIAAYRAGTRAAARVQEERRADRPALPPAPRPADRGMAIPDAPRPADPGTAIPDALRSAGSGAGLPGVSGAAVPGAGLSGVSGAAGWGAGLPGAYRPADPGAVTPAWAPGGGIELRPGTPPPGQIIDPYGVGGTARRPGALRRPGATYPDGGSHSAPPGVVPRPGAAAADSGSHGASPGVVPPPGAVTDEGRTHTAPPGSAAGTRGNGGDPYGKNSTAGAPGARTDPYGTPAHGTLPGAPDPAMPTPGAGTATHPTTPWAHRGPTTALAAERARQARMAVVGPVTERWAPEQAGPVHENWQLAPPIGPATDLWALGALLFRAVQGHAPYPEENTAELVQLVCAEPPAFAEECGPLRPVVESLLRQDPTERLGFEELRGWLRSLVRSAPEPEAGTHVVAAPPVDPGRLPIVRRRGELVRRRRAGLPTATQARHKRAKDDRPARPRRLGRALILLILLALAAAITYATAFMPKAESGSGGGMTDRRTGAAGDVTPAPQQSETSGPQQPARGTSKSPSQSAGSAQTQTGESQVAQGFTLRTDSDGFRVAVANGWDRTPKNGQGQVVYSQGDFEMIVVPGRDSTSKYGSDPLTYQTESEPELQPFRDSTWATSSGLRRVNVGGRAMAEGQFTWTDGEGRELFVRNLVVIVAGRYHIVQVRGPEAELDEVTRLFEQAEQTYQATG